MTIPDNPVNNINDENPAEILAGNDLISDIRQEARDYAVKSAEDADLQAAADDYMNSTAPDTFKDLRDTYLDTADAYASQGLVEQIPVQQIPNQTAQPVYQPRRQSGKVGTLFFCLWVVFAMLLVQTAVSLIGLIPVMVNLLMETGLDMDQFMKAYTDLIRESPLVAGMQLVATASGALAMGLWYYLGYVRKDKRAGTYDPVWPKLRNRKVWLFLICGTIACYISALLLNIIACSLFPAAAEELESSLDMALGKYTWLGLLIAVILAPIGEECAVRGIIVRRSERVFSMIGCVIISAVFFGLLHMNLIQGLYVLPTGAFLGYVSYKYHSVIPCIFCHLLFNLIGMTIPIAIDNVGVLAVLTLVTIIFTFLAIFFGRQLFGQDTQEQA